MAIAITIAETIIDTGVTVGTTVVTLDYPGPQGPQGDSGVVGVTSPITNTGTAGSANIGLNQSLLSLAREQIIGTAVTTIAGKALTAGTADYATLAGTAGALSANITKTQVTGTAVTLADTSTVTNAMLAGSIAASKISGTAAVLGANTFTGKQTLPASTASNASLNLANGTAPTTPATGDLWASSGSLIYQSSLGAQTLAFLSSNITGTSSGITGSITASQVSGTAAVLNVANVFTVGGQVIKTGTDGTAGVAIWRNSASQSAALFTLYKSDGSTNLAEFNAKGALALTPDAGTALTVNGASTSAVQMIVKGAVSQTGNLQEWQDSSATRASVSSAGQFTISPSSGTALTVNAASGVGMLVKADAGTNDIFQAQINSAATNRFIINTAGRTAIGSPATVFNSAFLSVSSAFATNPAIVARAVASQTASIQEWQDSSGNALGGRNAVGQLWSGSTSPVLGTIGAAAQATGTSSGTTATITTRDSGGVATNHNLSNGDLVTITAMTPSGYQGTYVISNATGSTFTVTTSGSNLGNGTGGTVQVPAQASITARSAGTTGLVVKSAANQSANLQMWTDSAGTVLAQINSAGFAILSGMRSTNYLGSHSSALTNIVSNATTGHLILGNTGTVPNTPSGGGVLYSEGGALKWRGSSGTITTIAVA